MLCVRSETTPRKEFKLWGSSSFSSAATVNGKAFRKSGIKGLTIGTFAMLYLALASEFLVRIGKLSENKYVERLPEPARGRFSRIRRCTFCCATDRTSMEVAADLVTAAVDHNALRKVILGVCVFHKGTYEKLSNITYGLDAGLIEQLLADSVPKSKTTCSAALQTGSLAMLRGGRTGKSSMFQLTAGFVVRVNRHVKVAWERICRCESVMAVLMDPTGLSLCWFRAHCVCRIVWYMTCGRIGTPPWSFLIGEGACDAVRVLSESGDGGEEDFKSLFPHLLAAVESVAPPGLLDNLHLLGLHPNSPQVYEHILCECGKIFGEGRYSQYVNHPGYAELFWRASPFYLQRVGFT